MTFARTRPNFQVTNQSKASSVSVDANSVFVGTVVAVGANGVFVNAPTLTPNERIGPCATFSKKPRVGEKVLIGFLEGQRQKLVILGTATTDFRISKVDDPTQPDDVATKKYVDDQILALDVSLKAWVAANFD